MEFGQVGVVLLLVLGVVCEARWFPSGQATRRQLTTKPPTTKFHQSKQTKQVSMLESTPTVKVEEGELVRPNSVAARCGEHAVRVEVKQDLFDIGQLIQPEDLTLGDCVAEESDDPAARILQFESALQGCGSTLTITEDALIYIFKLVYKPQALDSTPIVRTDNAEVYVECHYMRKQNVSSNAVQPTWTPYSDYKVAEELLYFSLKLMTDDWMNVRGNPQYYLGNLLNIEASVLQYNHSPLRVFVDSCVATMGSPDNTDPSCRYAFIQNHGCLVDAKLTGSVSQFLPRSQESKLQFQLEAFRFSKPNNGTMYITCHLKATTASSPISVDHKACSFIDRWRAVSGEDQVCDCCDSQCGTRNRRDLTREEGDQWDTTAILGPIHVLD